MPRRAKKAPAPAAQGWRDPAAFALILCLTFIAYLPALNGTRLWDDEAHITRPELQSLHGLWRIWFDLGATQQYYPLLHSAFWLEHILWGDSTTGYHVLNIFLHAICAWLVVLIVRRLEIGGAWLAGAVFALHPVCVEAVAWISEQKSTLSGVFCLLAAVLYLDFDRTRRRPRYIAALALFGCALMSKSVTATLPAALLVLFWWKRGRLDAKRDVFPLLPWLALGAASGLFTAWVERHFIHAEGADFTLTFADRILLAGRVPWLYLLHIVWPANLSFFYPRFSIDSGDPLQYLFPAVTILAFAGLAVLARTRRSPLAAALLFVGILFPVLGFLNVYPFVYSWVADHFGYLASIAVIVPVCALLARNLRGYAPAGAAALLRNSRKTERGAIGSWLGLGVRAAPFALLAVLGLLTWRQSRDYSDLETLWRATIQRNPSAWMAHYNLGVLYAAEPGCEPEAIAEYRAAIFYKPDLFRAHANLAGELEKTPESFAEALTEYETALRLNPEAARTQNDYGLALLRIPERFPEALAHLETAVRLDPGQVAARNNLAMALARIPARAGEAEVQARVAIDLDPSSAEPHNTLGAVLVNAPGRAAEAIAEFQAALRLKPDYRDARYNLANGLAHLQGRMPEAIAEYQTLLRAWPNDADGHYSLAIALSRMQGERDTVIDEFETALRLNPGLIGAHYDVALVLASIPGRMPEAIAHLEAAHRLNPASAEVNQMLARARTMQSGASMLQRRSTQ